MNTQEVLNIVKERGLRIVLKDDRPVLERAEGSKAVTDALLSVLKIHRERIIALLKQEEQQS